MPDVTVEVLERARNKIKRGWVKGNFQLGQNFCAVGAIREALEQERRKGTNVPFDAEICLTEKLAENIPKRNFLIRFRGCEQQQVMAYNDARLTTKFGVLRMFGKTIKKAKKELKNVK